MDSLLPPTGTSALLAQLAPHIPDEFINDLCRRSSGRGRRCEFSPAQLWRVHLLALLTPVHSFNLLLELLSEQREWRRFAHLPHRQRLPGARMLHEFREHVSVTGLRQINAHLLAPLIPKHDGGTMSVALIDATDLPASASGHKKRARAGIRLRERRWVVEL